jgi:hypothetical protein
MRLGAIYMEIRNIYLGYWYQRTTLHLSELYDFFYAAKSPLALDHSNLEKLKEGLGIENVAMNISYFEYIQLDCLAGVKAKIYEDGLVIFTNDATDNIAHDINELNAFFEEKFNPAQNYLFSLGAPVPKELADIKTISPFFIVTQGATEADIDSLFKAVGETKYYEIKSHDAEIYRGSRVFVINVDEDFKNIEDLIEMQIFFKEFKSQLHRYLNMHRIIWEKIAEVKEKGEIKGRDVSDLRNQLESYKKTIQLIDGRIGQMGTHMKTRQGIISGLKWEQFLTDVLQFKYDTLSNTHNYIKSLWVMTSNYVDSAINLFSDIQAKSTESSVTNLAIITSMGVGATLIGLFTKQQPEFTLFGAGYFFALAFIGYITNKIMKTIYANRMYKIKDIKITKNIK